MKRRSLQKRNVLPYPSIFGSLATSDEAKYELIKASCHTLLFSGHLQQQVLPGCKTVPGCHTLLFSGHLQLSSLIVPIRNWMLPYPSIFGSLATFPVIFPSKEIMLPYPSIFGSLATQERVNFPEDGGVAIPFYFRVTCNLVIHFILPLLQVAIPFYFRVTCNLKSITAFLNCSVAIPFYFRVTCNNLTGHPSNVDGSVAIPFYFRVTCN